MINYKKILLYYIQHVGFMEGTDFISSIDLQDELTEEERDELRRLGNLYSEDFEKELVINE